MSKTWKLTIILILISFDPPSLGQRASRCEAEKAYL